MNENLIEQAQVWTSPLSALDLVVSRDSNEINEMNKWTWMHRNEWSLINKWKWMNGNEWMEMNEWKWMNGNEWMEKMNGNERMEKNDWKYINEWNSMLEFINLLMNEWIYELIY